MKQRFDFGRNWESFSKHALTPERVEQAKKDFAELVGPNELQNRSFLDIGFGQGLSILSAASMGAMAVGCELDPLCADVLRENQRNYFPKLADGNIPLVIGSILDEATIESLREKSPDENLTYQIVHAWGVLHHTGDMRRAIYNVTSLVASDGYLIISIYGRHWSSGIWKMIKRVYNASPAGVRRLLVRTFYPVIYLAKWLVTGDNPLRQRRGMDFYYDVVDWIGGYPYEYATVNEITNLLKPLGFRLERLLPASVPTGCNQYVFRHVQGKSESDLH